MRAKNIDVFFKELSTLINKPLTVTLTGGAFAILHGVERATEDIDFQISADHDENLEKFIRIVERKTGIRAQFSEDIGRWSMIVMPRQSTTPYKKWGRLQIRFLSTPMWAVGKLARFLPSDESDLVTVLKKTQTSPEQLARLWGQALGLSPLSSHQQQFRRHVEYFFDRYSKELWKSSKKAEALKKLFHTSAQAWREKRKK